MLLFLIKQHAVAVTFKVRVGYLVAEFLALALVVLGFLQPAGAVAAFFLEPFKNRLDDFLVLI